MWTPFLFPPLLWSILFLTEQCSFTSGWPISSILDFTFVRHDFSRLLLSGFRWSPIRLQTLQSVGEDAWEPSPAARYSTLPLPCLIYHPSSPSDLISPITRPYRLRMALINYTIQDGTNQPSTTNSQFTRTYIQSGHLSLAKNPLRIIKYAFT